MTRWGLGWLCVALSSVFVGCGSTASDPPGDGSSANGSGNTGGSGGNECPVGEEGCSCHPDGTCNASLSCFSELCVDANLAGSTGSGGNGAAGDGGTGAGGNQASGGNSGVGGLAGVGGASSGGSGNGGVAGSGGSGGNAGSGGTTVVECSDALESLGCPSAALQRRSVSVLLVIDKSGSMAFEGDGTTRWSALRTSIAAILPPLARTLGLGLQLFPYPNDEQVPISATECGAVGNCCEMPEQEGINVNVGTGSAKVEEILALLDTTEPGGGTPAGVALEKAGDYFSTGDGAGITGDRYVLFVTDGGANCNPAIECDASECTTNLGGQVCEDAPGGNCCDPSFAGDGSACLDADNVLTAIQALQADGVRTLVVGLPGTELYSAQLDEFAVAGGMPLGAANEYYRVDDLTGLEPILASALAAALGNCTMTLDPVPSDTPRVLIDCVELQQDTSGAGWEWDGGDLTLLGESCALLEQAAAAALERGGSMPAVDVISNCDF